MTNLINLPDLVKGYEFRPQLRDRITSPFTVWPSEASCVKPNGTTVGKCLRQMYYEWKKVPTTNTISEHLILTIIWGQAIEAYLIKKFQKMGILVGEKEDYAFKFSMNDIRVSGRLDGIIKQGNQAPIIEIKTYENDPKYIQEMPKIPHLLQIFLYICLYRPKVPFGLLYYRQRPQRFGTIKDICHRVEFIKQNGDAYPVINGNIYKEISFKGIVSQWKKAKYFITNNILPPKSYTGKSKQCSWCLHRGKCKQDGD